MPASAARRRRALVRLPAVLIVGPPARAHRARPGRILGAWIRDRIHCHLRETARYLGPRIRDQAEIYSAATLRGHKNGAIMDLTPATFSKTAEPR